MQKIPSISVLTVPILFTTLELGELKYPNPNNQQKYSRSESSNSTHILSWCHQLNTPQESPLIISSDEVLTYYKELFQKKKSHYKEKKETLCRIFNNQQNMSKLLINHADYHFPSSFVRHNIYLHYFFSHFLLSIKVP